MVLGIVMSLQGCKQQAPADFSTPENAFAALTNAIRAKDLDAYRACWYPEKADGEGLVATLSTDQSAWDGLQKLFHADSKIVDPSTVVEGDLTIVTYEVETPGIENGEHVNAVSFVRTGNEWKMYHW